MKPRVLFVCTGNSIRSQMAEALLREMAGERFDVLSAGTHPSVVHPAAAASMREVGIDISAQESRAVTALASERFDHVITVCDNARERCPVFPGAARRHWSVADPTLVRQGGRERVTAFRLVREDLADRIRRFLTEVDRPAEAREPAV